MILISQCPINHNTHLSTECVRRAGNYSYRINVSMMMKDNGNILYGQKAAILAQQ